MKVRTFVVGLGALWGSWVAEAEAQTQAPPTPAALTEARTHYERGIALADEGNAAGAMEEFSQAYALSRNSAVLFNLSITHEALHQYAEALDALEQYAREAPATAMERNRASVDQGLRRLRDRVGTVLILERLPGLEVRLDGLAPRAEGGRQRVDAGRHRVSLSAPGYIAAEVQVEVPAGATATVETHLQPQPSTVAVICNVDDAEVWIDGAMVGKSPLPSPVRVSEGQHQVEVRRLGYTRLTQTVEAVGVGARVDARLQWADPQTEGVASRLILRLPQQDAIVRLDGRRIGMDGGDLLPPGHHQIQLEHLNYLPLEQELELQPGRTHHADVSLTLTPAARRASVGRLVILGGVIAGVGGGVAVAGAAWLAFNQTALADAQNRENFFDGERQSPRRLSCTDPDTGDTEQSCFRLWQDWRSYRKFYEQFTVPSAVILGVGALGVVGGLLTIFLAPLADPGEKPARIQLQAGLGSVSLIGRF